MKQNCFLIFINSCLIIFFSIGCKERRRDATAVIIKETIFDSIPSGSGLEKYNDSLFIVGDDAGFLYQVSLKNLSYKMIPLSDVQPPVYRMPKESKTDYESATMINYHQGKYLLAFGSGSKSPERDSLLIVDVSLQRVDTILSIKPFYDHLMQVSKTDKTSFNIEGAAVMGDKLVLLNRGNNMIYSFDAEKFIEYVLTKGTPPAIQHFRATLPKIGNYEARISGAASAGDELLFCASVEQTNDWTKDGPISGSFIGLMNENKKEITLSAMLTHPDGKTAIEKIESVISLKSEANGDMVILALADNDDGKTKMLEIMVRVISDK